MPQGPTNAVPAVPPGLASAPAVRFPLVRSGRLLASLLACALLAPATMGGIMWQGHFPSPLHGLVFVLIWLLAATAAVLWWRRLPAAGWLDWNGAEWMVQAEGVPQRVCPAESMKVAVDVQEALLLRCAWGPGARCVWLWLERRHAPTAWLALRRALYAHTSRDADRTAAIDAEVRSAPLRSHHNDDPR